MFTITKTRLVIASLAIYSFLSITACNNKTDYTIARKEVLALHDQVMTESGKAEGIELEFKSQLKLGLGKIKQAQPTFDTIPTRLKIITLNTKLGDADTAMENWMHAYNNEFKGKSDQEAFDYFNTEKAKIFKIDSLYKKALQSADSLLKSLHTKPASMPAMDGKMKM